MHIQLELYMYIGYQNTVRIHGCNKSNILDNNSVEKIEGAIILISTGRASSTSKLSHVSFYWICL